jgi:rhodanese-related sulfurtransferase
MNKISKDLIKKAQSYGNIPALQPKDAYELIENDSSVILVDVRTRAEFDWVGKPVVNNIQQYVHIEWLMYPGSAQNPDFLVSLNKFSKNTTLVFLCRSGIRSKMAVQTALDNGFDVAIDIIGGFEGQRNSSGHRKTIDGWCYYGLPWVGA